MLYLLAIIAILAYANGSIIGILFYSCFDGVKGKTV